MQMDDEAILSVSGLEIYPGRRKIYCRRKEISLTAKEYSHGREENAKEGWKESDIAHNSLHKT